MSNLSNYAKPLVRDYVHGLVTHVALYTSDPTDDNTGTEVAGNGYARQAITFVNGANAAIITFQADGSGTAWGNVTHIGFLDALTVGNLIAHRVLPEVQTVGLNGIVVFAVGEISGAAN